MAAHLYESLRLKSAYYLKTSGMTQEEYQKKLMDSATVYIGQITPFILTNSQINRQFIFFAREESLWLIQSLWWNQAA